MYVHGDKHENYTDLLTSCTRKELFLRVKRSHLRNIYPTNEHKQTSRIKRMFRDNFQRRSLVYCTVHCVLHFAWCWGFASRAHSSEYLCVNEATWSYKRPMRTGEIERPGR